ncbi:MAG: hypothetical protein JWN25_2772 [Verrucomicrobiales bacterium]|nr:hypothetical protein [Verrucomicrobiales bacterium]
MKRPVHLCLLLLLSNAFYAYGGCLPTGYLSVIGPASFRFQDPEMITVKRPMPPLPAKPIEPVMETAPKTTNAVPVKGEALSTNDAPAVVMAAESGTPPARVEPPVTMIESSAKETQIINPTVLLKFFNGGKTNANGNTQGIAVPIGFNVPGSTAAPPSSTATYSTSP